MSIGQCPNVLNVKKVQQGEGTSKGLLCDYEPSCGPSLQALAAILYIDASRSTQHIPRPQAGEGHLTVTTGEVARL